MSVMHNAEENGPASLPRLDRERAILGNEVADTLRKEITFGRLQAGSKITEEWVSREVGVSRGPVREAFRALANEGLVVLNAYKGATVADVTLQELQNVLIPVRVVLEREAALRAIETTTSAQGFADLDELVQGMFANAAGEWNEEATRAVIELDVRFHERLTAMGEQYHTLQLWRSIESRIRVAFTRLAPHHRSLTEIAQEHADLLAALRTKDPETVVLELERHIQSSVIELIERAEHDASGRK